MDAVSWRARRGARRTVVQRRLEVIEEKGRGEAKATQTHTRRKEGSEKVGVGRGEEAI